MICPGANRSQHVIMYSPSLCQPEHNGRDSTTAFLELLSLDLFHMLRAREESVRWDILPVRTVD
eukprot:30249-Eustigmatos_ZCMA.PRE.1